MFFPGPELPFSLSSSSQPMSPTTIPARKLPPSFTSLYRLFLRTSSAAVLHHGAATRHVRTLWKPTFREAAVVVHKLQSPTLGTSEKEQLEKWHSRWESSSECQVGTLFRPTMLIFVVDRTLSLLITSAQSRGLANKLTRNLAFLHFEFHKYQVSTRYGPWQFWDPRKREYKPARQARPSRTTAERFDGQSWGALEETARMAEEKSGLMLGRMEFRPRRA